MVNGTPACISGAAPDADQERKVPKDVEPCIAMSNKHILYLYVPSVFSKHLRGGKTPTAVAVFTPTRAFKPRREKKLTFCTMLQVPIPIRNLFW